MKTLTNTGPKHMNGIELVFIQPLKPVILVRHFQHYIETSDWDEQIIRKGPLFDRICMAGIILSGLILLPFIVAALCKATH